MRTRAAHVTRRPADSAPTPAPGTRHARNLTTELISVLRGHADPRLLDDHESGHRAVGWITVEEALLRGRARVPVEGRPLLSGAAAAIGGWGGHPGLDDRG
ncbi:hypothetical protein AB0L06_40785 [Spirillospora sp. NPDC052269]